jgi:hypothetical protein
VWTGDRSDGVAAQQSIRSRVWAVAWVAKHLGEAIPVLGDTSNRRYSDAAAKQFHKLYCNLNQHNRLSSPLSHVKGRVTA